jgi:hypothetical protein
VNRVGCGCVGGNCEQREEARTRRMRPTRQTTATRCEAQRRRVQQGLGRGGRCERYASASRASTHLMEAASKTAQAAGSNARTQHGRGHTDQRSAGAAGGTAQGRRNAGVPSGVHRWRSASLSGNSNTAQPWARAPEGGETIRLRGESMTAIRACVEERSS